MIHVIAAITAKRLVLMPTMPYSSASPTRQTRPTSRA